MAPFGTMLRRWVSGGSEHSMPATPPDVIHRSAGDFAERPGKGLRITWLGHSTLLIEIDGYRLLVDPVWGDRASPFTWAGPKRFYPPPLALDAIPRLDAVLISHDHYDHLDYPTIETLSRRKDLLFLAPLGVGAHLEYWGVAAERIVELDWWQEHGSGDLTFVATPARHFSGRSVAMTDRNQTLWDGWAVIGPEQRIYYSGDTALFPEMPTIGKRFGPFDATMIEAGAYNAMWADVHLGPEQAVLAHRLVKGKLMVPVHWGLFDLALHGWTEPVERVIVAAKAQGVTVVTPAPGGTIDVDAAAGSRTRWWPSLPFETDEQAPAYSSSVDALLRDALGRPRG
jgi:L-ascorbate metabolism protein UlaG (beta-lactamase superfamily)